MPKEGKGRIIKLSDKADTRYVSIPAKVASDSQFPFSDGEEVRVIIHPDKKCLTVSKIE
ncbi:hypothetical protein Metfor_1372 [Methanoregula formicica SMSP]|uniref:AbrB/MazE/SpoVT family DNA-binding domain-containing protein n=1 Tax=Methanoregula formicica (strain DSM 22288 / NBRC 105244 / SMSP) TaxID=593750 RepID=L0HF42_METFS|nr:hypothetical protein Metfor_1372 [Methanoregula formicica SMSP]